MTRPRTTQQRPSRRAAGSRRSPASRSARRARRSRAQPRLRGRPARSRHGPCCVVVLTMPAALRVGSRDAARRRRRRRRARRSWRTCPWTRTPGASSTVSPGVRERARPRCTTRSMAPVSVPVDVDDGDIGRVSRERLARSRARSRPSSTTPRSRSRGAARPGRRTSAPLAARRRPRRRARRPAATRRAACGLVALESSTQATPSTAADRRRSGGRPGRKRAQPVADGRRRHAVAPGPGPRRRARWRRCAGAGAAEVGERARARPRWSARSLDERAVDQHVVDDAEHADRRDAEGEADRARQPSTHVGLRGPAARSPGRPTL